MDGGEEKGEEEGRAEMTPRSLADISHDCRRSGEARQSVAVAEFWVGFGKVHHPSQNVSRSRGQLRSWASKKRWEVRRQTERW